MSNPLQEPPASSKASNEDLKDLDLFEPSKPRLRAKIWHIGVSKTGDHIKNKIRIPNPSQELLAPSKALNEDLKDNDVLCTFKINILRQNLEYGCIKDQWPYPNKYPDVKPQSRTSSTL